MSRYETHTGMADSRDRTRGRTVNMKRLVPCVLIGILVLALSSCTALPKPEPGHRPVTPPIDLSGDWEYQDDETTQKISLDEQGNGQYAWQGGRFLTTSFSEERWDGHWSQKGNDREGGFTLRPSADGKEAEGTWWYTRIGDKEIPPHAQGGSFRMRHVHPSASGPSSITNQSPSPPLENRITPPLVPSP
jgi:hypothetical protein